MMDDKFFLKCLQTIMVAIVCVAIVIGAYNYLMGIEYVKNGYEQVQVVGTNDYRWQKSK